ncbi:MAG: hypothetical protein ABI865_08145 [Nitrosospira sp.]
MASGVGFLNLAYLVEISVVLNLAYRELKFAKLDEQLVEMIASIEAEAKKAEIFDPLHGGYIELQEIRSLKTPSHDGRNLWENVPYRKWFYDNFIQTRTSLGVANYSILVNVGLIILFSILSQISVTLGGCDPISFFQTSTSLVCKVPVAFMNIVGAVTGGFIVLTIVALGMCTWPVFIKILAWGMFISVNFSLFALAVYYEESNLYYTYLWLVSLGTLVTLCILPLIFIKMASLCQVFLFGGDNQNRGVVHDWTARMFQQKQIEVRSRQAGAIALKLAKRGTEV